jgi:hypothetical protein
LIADIVGTVIVPTALLVLPRSELLLWIATVGIGLSMASIYATTFSIPSKLGVTVSAAISSVFVG